MYTPTHIVVTVHKARGLLTKGKNGTNNCFTTIALGKEKFQTSIKDSAVSNVEWHEECELAIPTQGNRAELILTCLHHNGFGIDEFLGQVSLPLNQMDQFERPRGRWYKLQSKPGHDKKDKDRGELEIRTSFTVKAGSLSDLNKKDSKKASTTGGVGGSLLSLGSIEKRKSLAKFAKSLGSKMHVTGRKKKDKSDDSDSFSGSFSSLGTPSMSLKNSSRSSGIGISNADPGVISEDEDEFVFDNLSHKSSATSLGKPKIKSNNLVNDDINEVDHEPVTFVPTLSKIIPPSVDSPPKLDEWERKLYGTKNIDQMSVHNTDSLKRRSTENSRVPLNSTKKDEEEEASMDRISLSDNHSRIEDDEFKSTPTQQLGRSATATEPIVAMNEEFNPNTSPISLKERADKEKDNIFSKKWRNFKRELAPGKQDEQIKNQLNKTPMKGERIIEGSGQKTRITVEKKNELPIEIRSKYEGKSKEDVMRIAHQMENDLIAQKRKNKELEEYLDVLLLKVMETHPKILQNPYPTKNHIKQSG